MKSFISNIIARVTIIATAVAAALGATAQTYTITLVDNTVYTYEHSALDSIQFVGGSFGSTAGVGVKVYPTASGGHSLEFLYSQISSLVITGGTVTVNAPTISPNGGSYTAAQSVTVSTTTTGATVYYTTDGTTPSASNYTGRGTTSVTFTLSATATVKAVAIYSGTTSATTSATFTITTSSDDNTNRNTNIAGWASLYSYDYWQPWRLEFPHLKTGANNSWSVQYTTDSAPTDHICYSLEWDNSLIANRWVCYQFNPSNYEKKVSRTESWAEDSHLPSSTRSKASDYSSSGFTKGHLCPSNDRVYSTNQNKLTFCYSNMQPQYTSHNNGLWNNIEQEIQNWVRAAIPAGTCDTLYVVRAATIDNVTINGTTSSGVYSGITCGTRLPVPKYFYTAMVAYNKTTDTWQGIALWTEHTNTTDSNKNYGDYAITIQELENRTGIDFFCNIRDDIEEAVEATYNLSYWGFTTSN